jgi:hypothetical protein
MRSADLIALAVAAAPLTGCSPRGRPATSDRADVTAAASFRTPDAGTVARDAAAAFAGGRPTSPLDDARTVILDEAAVKERFERWADVEVARYQRPTPDEIHALESALPDALDRVQSPEAGEEPLSLRANFYLRQYIGYVDRDGQRRIWGNFLCRDPGKLIPDVKWREHLVIVHDGGDCYFNVDYSVTAGTFLAIRVNGTA